MRSPSTRRWSREGGVRTQAEVCAPASRGSPAWRPCSGPAGRPLPSLPPLPAWACLSLGPSPVSKLPLFCVALGVSLLGQPLSPTCDILGGAWPGSQVALLQSWSVACCWGVVRGGVPGRETAGAGTGLRGALCGPPARAGRTWACVDARWEGTTWGVGVEAAGVMPGPMLACSLLAPELPSLRPRLSRLPARQG